VTLSLGAAALLTDDPEGRRLVMTRRAGVKGSFPGFWEFPGGGLEAGETPEGAVRREIREELGLEIEALRPLGFDLSDHEGRRHGVWLFGGRVDLAWARFQAEEVAEAALVDLEADLPRPLFPRVEEERESYRRSGGLRAGNLWLWSPADGPFDDPSAPIGLLFGSDATTLVADRTAFPPAFFDLASGFLGETLQKLTNYRKRLVVTGVGAGGSKAWQALVRESHRGGQMVFVETLVDALPLLGPDEPGF